MTTLPLGDLIVGDRDRTDLGDIAALADSIKAVGLLHPIVVTASNELVAGDRRLSAVRSLGWTQVPVTVVDLDSVADVLRAEADENTCRKSLSPYEADRARERRERVLRDDASARMKSGKPSPNLGEGSRKSKETSKAAAIGTGYSGSTLDKVRKIRTVAEKGETTSGIPVPEPVQQVAREAVEEIKVTGAAVESASRKVDEALSQYVEQSADVKQSRLKHSIWREVKAAHGLAGLSAEHVAAVCDDQMWNQITYERDRLITWVNAVDKARPRGLRVVGKD